MELRKVKHFHSRLEAEAVGNALAQYDIPFLVRSEDLGIFGPGHTGATPQGASLWVPDEHFEQVRQLLTCFFEEQDPALHDPEP